MSNYDEKNWKIIIIVKTRKIQIFNGIFEIILNIISIFF